jgi:penicillin-binding protein 1C
MEWYYKSLHIDYKPLPPFREDCQQDQKAAMDFIYPKTNSKIYLAKDFNSNVQPVILKVAHSNREAKLYWYVDNEYKGTTQTFHEMQIEAETGIHYITVADEFGNEIKRKVEIIKD